MRKNYGRLITAIILAAALGTGLTACGSSASEAEAASNAAAESAAEEAAESVAEEEAEAAEEDTEQEEAAEEVTEKRLIKAATSGSPRPFTYVDEDGELAGQNIELIKAVFERLPQYDLEIEVTEFSSIFTGIDAGLYDLGVNNLAKNPDREAKYLFTDPEMVNHYLVVANKDIVIDEIKDLTELAGTTFVGTAGNDKTTIIEKYNDEHPDQQITIEYSEAGVQEWLEQIDDGRVDFTIIDEPMYYGYYKTEFDFNVNEYDLSNISSATYSYFIVAQDDTQLAEDINNALQEVFADGTSTEIDLRYFGVDYTPGISEDVAGTQVAAATE